MASARTVGTLVEALSDRMFRNSAISGIQVSREPISGRIPYMALIVSVSIQNKVPHDVHAPSNYALSHNKQNTTKMSS